MKNVFLFLIMFGMVSASSQSVYVELLGKGFGNSINYEYNLNKQVQGFNIQVGAGYVPTSLISIPGSINYVFGRNKHHLEVGGGLTYVEGYIWADDDKIGPDFGLHANILYRYQKRDGRFFFKTGFTPFLSENFEVGPWFGIGFGYSFFSIE